MRFRLIAAALMLLACREPTTARPLTGTYTLVALNDGTLPQVIASIPPEIVQVTGGEITLADDSTFQDVTRWRVMDLNGFTDHADTVRGTYSRSTSTLTMSTPPDARGTITRYVLELHDDGSLTRFFKRSELGGPYLDVTYRYVKH